jgi:8-oxo-dGTP diphosphatase
MALVEVVAAVLTDRKGRYLLAQRPVGKVYAGYWEFPGGKVEPGESLEQALVRELHEELGISVRRAFPWMVQQHEYPHAHVRLNLFRVVQWDGEPRPLEDQALAWQGPGLEPVAPMLPANTPILHALELPVVYGVTHAEDMGEPAFLESLERAFFRGLRLVQLREKELPAELLLKLAKKVVHAAKPYRARVLVNGNAEVAAAAGADGVHLSAIDLAKLEARPHFPLVGASCHTIQELRLAERWNLDFAVLGPIAPTRTHPGTIPLGFEAASRWIRDCALPVYGIGGLGLGDLEAAWQAGAQGIASMRAIWEGNAPIPSRFRLI